MKIVVKTAHRYSSPVLSSRTIVFAREARKNLLKAHSGERGIGLIPSHRVKRRTLDQLLFWSRSTQRYNLEVMAMIRDEYYSSQQKSVYATKLLRSNNKSARLCKYFSLVLTNFIHHVLQCRTSSTSSLSVRGFVDHARASVLPSTFTHSFVLQRAPYCNSCP